MCECVCVYAEIQMIRNESNVLQMNNIIMQKGWRKELNNFKKTVFAHLR